MDLWRVRSIPFTLLWIAYSRCFVACRACNVCSLISLCSTLLVGPYITFFTFENFPCRCLAELAELPCIAWEEVCRSLSVRLQRVQEKCVDMFGKFWQEFVMFVAFTHIHTFFILLLQRVTRRVFRRYTTPETAACLVWKESA